MIRTRDWIAGLLLVSIAASCAEQRPAPATTSPDPAKSATDTPAAEAPANSPATNSPAKEPAPVAATPRNVRPLTEAEWSDGWLSLFDGETLFGWQAATKADWRVEDGAIVVGSGEPGLLCTTSPFADYVLRVEFRADEGTNSGIFLRTVPKPTDPARDCYELNIAPGDNPFPTGSFVKRKKVEGNLNRAEWQSYEVTVEGPKLTVQLDGMKVLEYDDPAPVASGLIGLQLNQGRVAFRNVRIKPLGLSPLFNGRDLTGWKSYPQMASKFTVTPDGLLNVRNGKGQLETEQSFGDFVLQLECQSHAPHLNSGIFYRCIPGEEMNGYESQIHNGFLDGDRTKPVDHGTGGIFRRVPARYVVADDQQWFGKTIIAAGPHVAVWVNGYQVTDWTDERKPEPNPRRGLRLEPGTIMIQGHDPTTNLSFRNLRIRSFDAK